MPPIVASGKPVPSSPPDDDLTFYSNGRGRKRKKLEYHFAARVATDALSLVEGPQGAGKTMCLCSVAAAITGGPPLPGKVKKRDPGPFLWLAGERNYFRDIEPRLEAAGANLKLMRHPHNRKTFKPIKWYFPGNAKLLESTIRNEGIKGVALDVLLSHLGKDCSMNDPQQIRPVMEELDDIARETDCAILPARHWRKDCTGGPMDRGAGAADIAGVSTFVLAVAKVPGREDLHALVRLKGNRDADPPALAFTIEPFKKSARIVWQGEYPITAEELVSGKLDTSDRLQSEIAENLLRNVLTKEGVKYADVWKLAFAAGVSERTLQRSMKKLGCHWEPMKDGDKKAYFWFPPEGGWPK
jgi:hypothetical protein